MNGNHCVAVSMEQMITPGGTMLLQLGITSTIMLRSITRIQTRSMKKFTTCINVRVAPDCIIYILLCTEFLYLLLLLVGHLKAHFAFESHIKDISGCKR